MWSLNLESGSSMKEFQELKWWHFELIIILLDLLLAEYLFSFFLDPWALEQELHVYLSSVTLLWLKMCLTLGKEQYLYLPTRQYLIIMKNADGVELSSTVYARRPAKNIAWYNLTYTLYQGFNCIKIWLTAQVLNGHLFFYWSISLVSYCQDITISHSKCTNAIKTFLIQYNIFFTFEA